MASFLLTPAAQADLDDIWDYTVERWGVAQAERYIREIQATCDALGNGKMVGRSAEEIRTGYRRYPAGSHVVFSRQVESTIEIVRVLHQNMDFDRRL